MPMTIKNAEKVKRIEIKPGNRYDFYSTALEARSDKNVFLYLYSAQRVEVISAIDMDPGEECEPMFKVQHESGDTWDVYLGELNGWYLDTGQYYRPTGDWAGN